MPAGPPIPLLKETHPIALILVVFYAMLRRGR